LTGCALHVDDYQRASCLCGLLIFYTGSPKPGYFLLIWPSLDDNNLYLCTIEKLFGFIVWCWRYRLMLPILFCTYVQLKNFVQLLAQG